MQLNYKITEKEIFEKYPDIFQEQSLPETLSPMHYGLAIPDHWLPAIDLLCALIKSQNVGYIKIDNDQGSNLIPVKAPNFVAEQVKSKFGNLRFYYRLDFSESFEDLRQRFDYADDFEYPEIARTYWHTYYNALIRFTEALVSKQQPEVKHSEHPKSEEHKLYAVYDAIPEGITPDAMIWYTDEFDRTHPPSGYMGTWKDAIMFSSKEDAQQFADEVGGKVLAFFTYKPELL